MFQTQKQILFSHDNLLRDSCRRNWLASTVARHSVFPLYPVERFTPADGSASRDAPFPSSKKENISPFKRCAKTLYGKYSKYGTRSLTREGFKQKNYIVTSGSDFWQKTHFLLEEISGRVARRGMTIKWDFCELRVALKVMCGHKTTIRYEYQIRIIRGPSFRLLRCSIVLSSHQQNGGGYSWISKLPPEWHRK